MKKSKKTTPVAIAPAGQRRDMTRMDNNAAIPLRQSLVEEIEWRKEHQQ